MQKPSCLIELESPYSVESVFEVEGSEVGLWGWNHGNRYGGGGGVGVGVGDDGGGVGVGGGPRCLSVICRWWESHYGSPDLRKEGQEGT